MQLHRSDLKEIGQMQLVRDVRQSECLKRDFAESSHIYLHSSHKTRLGTTNRGLHQIGGKTSVSRCIFWPMFSVDTFYVLRIYECTV